jgi:hypothetical protein
LHHFVRPTEEHLSVDRVPVDGACAECGATELASYRVLSEGGWWDVVKCQACLNSHSRTPGPAYGSFVPLGLSIVE